MRTDNSSARRVLLWVALAASAIAAHNVAAQQTVPFQASFPTSCSATTQTTFNHAITLLHSFEYPETTRIFGEVIEQEPDCAMAYWGAAMSIWHPLWAPPGEAQLAAGAGLLAATNDLQTTTRERAYIVALEQFYASNDTSTHQRRAQAYAERMQEVYRQNLDDPEAAVFYALALLATQDPRDKSYANTFKAAALLNWVRDDEPGHPGVMHYLIHSYDFPGLAHLALNVAETYAKAAPDSAHAQHMPSHIFTRLGLWDLSLASNHDSTRSAAEYTKRAHLPGHYDEGLHSIDYLMYAMLQTARDDEAADLLLRLADITRTDTENFKVAYTYAAAPARHVLERRAWEEASDLQLMRQDFAWEDFAWATSIHHFARGIGAARSGKVDAAREELAAIRALQLVMPDTTLPYWQEEVQVQIDVVMAWISLLDGQEPRALQLAAAAADREDAVDKHPVTPGEVLPARELYADMLFETGRYASALAQYREVLNGSPNRLNALIGAAHAAASSGDMDLADVYGALIRQQTEHGNPERAGLARFVQ